MKTTKKRKLQELRGVDELPEQQAVDNTDVVGDIDQGTERRGSATAQGDQELSGGEGKISATEATLEQKRKIAEVMHAAKQKGVVYMSRVPPHLKPLKLRHMLSPYGEIGRLYLAPEDPSLRKRRKKLKGNTGKNFSEGWVEFLDKKVAKGVAEMLNGNPMGGKHRSAYHSDLWNLKYLPKFKWDHLTEEIAYQNAVREQKLANEVSAAKRERDFYLSRVDKAKGQGAQEERRQKKLEEGLPAETEERGGQRPLFKRQERYYGQRKARPDPTEDADAPQMSHHVLSLLAGAK